jgi:hypothetical protein
MKPFTGAIIFLIITLAAAYDERNLADLCVPVQIPAKSLEINILHRFYRTPNADFPDNFITMGNVNIALRYVVWSTLEVGTGWVFNPKEYEFHAAYSYFAPKLFLRTQAYVQIFGAQIFDDQGASWKNNGLYQINLQSEPITFGKNFPIIENIVPTLNFIYDGLAQEFGIGTGIDIALPGDFDLVGEYFPVLGTRDTTLGGTQFVNCYSVGIKKTTFGHHFIFSVSNSTDLGVRHLMRGAWDNNIYFGFNIQRLISF